MGGTDKKDFMRGIYTVTRRCKKWWKSLWYWVLDSTMYNAYVLHRWCWNHFTPRRKYKLSYAQFIRKVANHFLIKKNPSMMTPRCAVRRSLTTSKNTPPARSSYTRVTSAVTSVPLLQLQSDSPTESHEGNSPVTSISPCPGADLEKRAKLRKDGSVDTTTCKYCYNAYAKPIRKNSSWQCSLCKVCLCVTCNVRYHRWLVGTECPTR